MNRLLVIDDEPGHRMMIRAVLEDVDWEVSEADNGPRGLAHLEKHTVDVVLLDMRMPGMDGQEVLERIHGQWPHLPVVMLTAFGTVGTAVEAMKRGAYDYLTKPADNDEIVAVLGKAAEYGRLLRENVSLKTRLAGRGEDGIVGDSEPLRQVRELIAQAGPAEATVLITGESGTGKELIADALHKASPRADKPLIKVNCAALPANLLESELFGYVKGAFTGAAKDKPGRFLLAQGGTLFLDEIGEIAPELQAKLLRVLQDRVVEPLGGIRPLPVDVRIIAATNRDLAEEVRQGNFREDLYYRLNVLEIASPPLRERPDDIPLLVGHLLKRLSLKNRKNVRNVTPAFLDALSGYPWPGNVRELENVLERALILTRSDELGVDVLPPQLLHPESMAPLPGMDHGLPSGPVPGQMSGVQAEDEAPASPASLEDAEKRALVRALEQHGGHRAKTADALGISRRTLQYKLAKYGLTKR